MQLAIKRILLLEDKTEETVIWHHIIKKHIVNIISRVLRFTVLYLPLCWSFYFILFYLLNWSPNRPISKCIHINKS